ncbi:hypothetical protein AgCh_007491 [Apium graveolens]
MVLLQNPINIKRKLVSCRRWEFENPRTAENEFKLEESHKSRRLELKGNLKSTEKKLYFIMCWVHEQPNDGGFLVASMVEGEKGATLACIMYKIKRKAEARCLLMSFNHLS